MLGKVVEIRAVGTIYLLNLNNKHGGFPQKWLGNSFRCEFVMGVWSTDCHCLKFAHYQPQWLSWKRQRSHSKAAVCYTEASRGVNTQTATQTFLPSPDALWVPGGQFSSSASVGAWHQHTHTHSTWFTVQSYNPICRGKVSLMTWQPGGFFIYYLATHHHIYFQLRRGDAGPRLCVVCFKASILWLLVGTNTWVVPTATRS